MATIDATSKYQYMFKYQKLISASFYKIIEEDQRSDETEFFNILNNNHNSTEYDINNIDVKSRLERQIRFQETKDSGGKFYKINSMKIRFFEAGEINGSSLVKILLRSPAWINIKTDDRYCFLWSILAKLHHCENDHSNRALNYRQ